MCTTRSNMRLNNVSFKFYMNNTAEPNWPGTDCTRIEDNCSDPVYLTPIDLPDIIMEGVARHKDRFFNQVQHAPFSHSPPTRAVVPACKLQSTRKSSI